jgi:hypothetical protein
MAVDRYTKVVLTVIAACLVWLSFGRSSLTTRVNAQGSEQRVIVAGWMDENGTVRPLPAAYWAGKGEPGKPVPPSALPIWSLSR